MSRPAVNMGVRALLREVIRRRCVLDWRLPMTFTNVTVFVLLACFLCPAVMAHLLLYPLFRLVFGTLYPAYASYKAVRTKNVKEYVKWMMYWIVFALFTCAETFTDVFCSFWFPFYYEFKVILVLWLLSPATKGSSILYRKFVHPMLTKREQEIDEYIAKAKEQGYHTVLTLGSKGVNYATTVIMQTAIKGGGGLVNQLRRSYSLSDISADMDALAEMNRIKALPEDELDLGDTPMPIDPRLRRSRGYSPRRSASGSGRVEMYFPEVDVNVRQRSTRPRETGIPLSHIRSNEDVSSGYSSAEMLYSGQPPASEAQEPLVRTSSVGSSRVTRTKVTRGGAIPKRPTAAEDNLSWSESEGSDSGTQEEYFYDVPSASPSESIATLPSATLSQPATLQPMGGDFKSHLPVALVGELQESEKNTECGDNVQHLTTSEKQGALTSLLINHEGGTLQNVIEALQEEKDNTEDKKDIIKDLKCVIAEENIESADNLQNLTTSEEQAALISLPTNQERDIVEMLMEVLQADKDNLEELKSLVREVTTSNDESMLLGSVDKETLCSEGATPSFEDAVSFPDVMKTSDATLAQDVDSIPTTVECEESKVEENLNTNMPQEQGEGEFYDTENDLPQNIIPSIEVSHFPAVSLSPVDYTPVSIDEIHNDNKLPENKTHKLVDECRAGRYHKHPAPCPPPQPNTEPLGSNTREEENGVEIMSVLEPVAPDRKSPSPKRESSVTKSPQSSPYVAKKNVPVVHDIIEGKSTASIEQTLPSVPVDAFEDAINMQYPVQATHIEKLDVKPSGSDSARPKVFASPNQKRKESKPKHESNIMSRIFSKPKNQLASFFPFLSTALTTSLTSLDGDLRAQDRARSSSIVGTTQTRSDYMSVPPELPPRRKTPDNSGESFRDDNTTQSSNAGGNRINIREMSHSPPRRHMN